MPKLEIIRELPAVEYLRECFDYDPETGDLRWKLRPYGHFARPVDEVRCNAMAGEIAGYFDNGYRRVSLGGVDYKAHRLIWKLVTGNEPSAMLDHADGNPANNRWENLREATQAEQTQNTKLRKDSVTGRRGVCRGKSDGKWRATIFRDGKQRHLGEFNSIEAASDVYEAAAQELFGKFYRQPQER
jgi:hypothetical protein